tara:strand:- start:4470 stop:5138 length:669 start_codon:yes stop_codon:yes gene_type:complete
MSSKAAPVQVDFVSDFVCPWCWLGHRNWLAAQKQAADIPVVTVWRPYELDPALPREGAPYKAYMKAKFDGSNKAVWQQMRDHLEAAAPGAGIEFRFDEITHRPSTLDAHRLMRWARGQDAAIADTVADKLFEAYFKTLENIGDPAVLQRIGTEAGMDGAVLADLLPGDRDAAAVRDEAGFFRKLGVTGVPTFIFNGQLALPGAAAPETLAEALREAASLPRQ